MAENSPAFQRRDQVMRALSPEGTAEPRCLSRPFGTHSSPNLKPGVEAPGYSHFVPSGHQEAHSHQILVALTAPVRSDFRVSFRATPLARCCARGRAHSAKHIQGRRGSLPHLPSPIFYLPSPISHPNFGLTAGTGRGGLKA